MGALRVTLAAALLFAGAVSARAAGLPSQSIDDNTQVFVCEIPSGCNTGSPAQQSLAAAPGLATYLASKLPASAGPVKVLGVAGNNTGAYTAPGILSTNRLLFGVAVKDNLSATSFNWTQAPILLAANLVNASAGWVPGAGTLTDPTAQNWTGYFIFWLYQ